MGWYIALGILVLLAIMPVGVSLIYQEDGLILSLLLGTVKIKLYPKSKKEKPEKKDKKEKKQTKPASAGEKKPEQKKKGGKLSDFLPLVDVALGFLGSLRRKLRVKRLELDLILAADDPCDLALNYGKAWAAVGNIMPLLEQMFVIKKRNVQVQCDFLADTTRITARLDVTITVGRVIGLAAKYGVLALREYFKLKKGGAVT